MGCSSGYESPSVFEGRGDEGEEEMKEKMEKRRKGEEEEKEKMEKSVRKRRGGGRD